MNRVLASITTSVDGYVTGPNDGPGKGLGEGGERLHYWVFGGPWSYDEEPTGRPGPVEQEWFDSVIARMGAAVAGRTMYEAAGHWGDTNPWGVPCLIVTHRIDEQPDGDDFVLVDGLAEAIERAKRAAGDKDVSLAGGADVIRQALELGLVDNLSVVIAPVILGAGTRLFEGFAHDIELEHHGVRQSTYATIIEYAVTRSRLPLGSMYPSPEAVQCPGVHTGRHHPALRTAVVHLERFYLDPAAIQRQVNRLDAR